MRAPVGGGMGAGPFHSQNVESWFTSVAGPQGGGPGHALRREGPAARRVRGRQPRPVPRAQAPLPLVEGAGARGPYTRAARPARVARAGRDATVVTYGVGVLWALEAAERLAARGPRDRGRSTCARCCPGTARRCSRPCARPAARSCCTRRPITGGFGGEMAAVIGQEAFEWLDAPVARLGGLDMPIPFSKALEEIFSPQGRLIAAIRKVLAY